MSIIRFVFLVISGYIAAMLLGSALNDRDLVCLFGSSVWVGVIIIIINPFKNNTNDSNE